MTRVKQLNERTKNDYTYHEKKRISTFIQPKTCKFGKDPTKRNINKVNFNITKETQN